MSSKTLFWSLWLLATAAPDSSNAVETDWVAMPSTFSVRLIQGGERGAVFKGQDRRFCHLFEKYVALVNESPYSPFEVIIHRRTDARTKELCRWDTKGALFHYKKSGPFYFYGIHGTRMFVDAGTGHERGIFIFDLETGAQLLATEWQKPIEVKDGHVLLWQTIARAHKYLWCAKDYHDGQGIVEMRFSINLHSMRKWPSLTTRCGFEE